ncbi:actin-binding protein IPP-like [Dermacentor andersoni]|uniref:actin-binding protein IPP-like n=1 Tax=Dermacentor andersoni TaxID=34620 RepID=UPI002155BAB5|nr:actin-binding protein IPP-like [Dermacentor andersoni]
MPPPSSTNLSWRPKGRGSRHHRDSGGSGGSGRSTGTGGQQRLFRSREYGSRVLGSLSELRESGMLCDVTLHVDGENFALHRVVLAASCPYFAAMFHSGLAESDRGTVEIRGVSATITDLLLGFIYTGEILITRDNCQDLLAAANMFRLADVVQACCDFLQRELHPSNCVGIFRFAEMHACTNLKLEAKRFIERRFTEVINEEEFYELPTETLRHFLKSEGLSIDNEFQVFDATMKWILHNVEERRVLFFDVLEAIRFPVISRKQLEQYADTCPDKELHEALLKLVQDLKPDRRLCIDGKSSQVQVVDVQQQPRMCARKSVYILGGCHRHAGMRFGEGYSLASVERFDPARGQWAGSLAPMAHPRSGPGAAALNQLVYVAGGESDCLILDSAEVFDPVANRWDSITPMVQPRCMMGMCALDGFLYAVGGWVGAELGDTVEKYDPELDTWQIISRMTIGRYAMGVLAHEGLIYVIGGYNDLNCELALVESYNPVTNEWQTLAPLRKRRAYVGVAVLHDHIYAVGGSSDTSSALNSVERYSIEENRWTELPQMSMARVGASVVGVNGRLHVMGGRRPSGYERPFAVSGPPLTLETAETYDPEVSMWSKATPMPLSRCYAAAVVV